MQKNIDLNSISGKLQQLGSSIGSAVKGGVPQGVYDKAKPVGDFLSKPNIMAMLLGGAGTGLVGGYLSSRAPEYPGEERGARRKRILLNTLLAGAAGAATVGGSRYALDQLSTAVPASEPTPQYYKNVKNVARAGTTIGTGAALVNRRGREDVAGQKNLMTNLGKDLERQLDGNQGVGGASLQRGSPARVNKEHLYNELATARADKSSVIKKKLHEVRGDPAKAWENQFTHPRSGAEFADVGINRDRMSNVNWKNWNQNPKNLQSWFDNTARDSASMSGRGGPVHGKADPREIFRDTHVGKFGRKLLGNSKGQIAGSLASLLGAYFAPDIVGGVGDYLADKTI